MVSDKAESCPHCGAPVTFSVNQQYNKQADYYDDVQSKKRFSPALVFLLSMLGALILAAGAFLLYKAVAVPNEEAVENDQTEALVDTTVVVEEAPVEEPATPQSRVEMSLWGSIGDTQCQDFTMNGTTGYYIMDGPDNVKRTMTLKSYDPNSGHCELDAYLRGKYIGTFIGNYELIGGEHPANIYKGKFHSVRGIVLDYYLYVD